MPPKAKRVDKNTGRTNRAHVGRYFRSLLQKHQALFEIALESDALAKSLARIEEALPHITMRADRELVENIIHGLGQIERRAAEWQTKRLVIKKVTPLRD